MLDDDKTSNVIAFSDAEDKENSTATSSPSTTLFATELRTGALSSSSIVNPSSVSSESTFSNEEISTDKNLSSSSKLSLIVSMVIDADVCPGAISTCPEAKTKSFPANAELGTVL